MSNSPMPVFRLASSEWGETTAPFTPVTRWSTDRGFALFSARLAMEEWADEVDLRSAEAHDELCVIELDEDGEWVGCDHELPSASAHVAAVWVDGAMEACDRPGTRQYVNGALVWIPTEHPWGMYFRLEISTTDKINGWSPETDPAVSGDGLLP